METKSTDSSNNPQIRNSIDTSSKTPATVVVPGMSPLPSEPENSGESTPQISFWAGLHLPLLRTAIVFGSILVLALIGSGLFNLAKNTIYNLTNKSTGSSPTQPKIEPSNSPAPATATSSTNNCTDLPSRMAQAKVTAAQVDKIFYQKHPKSSLSTTSVDRELRQEWCAIGNQLIEKK